MAKLWKLAVRLVHALLEAADIRYLRRGHASAGAHRRLGKGGTQAERVETIRDAYSRDKFVLHCPGAGRLAVRRRRRPQLVRDRSPQRRRREHLRLRAELEHPPPQLPRLRDAQAQDQASRRSPPGSGPSGAALADPARLPWAEADHQLGRARPRLDPERLS